MTEKLKRDQRRPSRVATAADFAFTVPITGTYTNQKERNFILKGVHDYENALAYVQSVLEDNGLNLDLSSGHTRYLLKKDVKNTKVSNNLKNYLEKYLTVDVNNWEEVEKLNETVRKITAAWHDCQSGASKKICDIDLLLWKIRVWCKKNRVAPSRLAQDVDLSPGALRDMMSPMWNPKVDTLRRIEAYMALFDAALRRGDRDPKVRIPDVVRFAHERDPVLGVSYGDDDNPIAQA